MYSRCDAPYGQPYPQGQYYPQPAPPGYYPPPCHHHERRQYSGCAGWLMALFAFCCGCLIGDYFDTDCCCCIIPCPLCPRC